MRVQWKPNYIKPERRLCLTRLRWETNGGPNGKPVGGHSNEVSVSLVFLLADLWVGAFWKTELWGWTLYLCLIPCFPLRIHRKRSYGGRFP